ncbi:hypothetical protein [Burkholderia pseudomallei]|uniref:hypothetical protein n=1 Tax=Burkholderia pseudomallei TaxID=28450 RepID=UPI001178CAA9|nr:hypothetical protein [Burkholderia pseudomallei]
MAATRSKDPVTKLTAPVEKSATLGKNPAAVALGRLGGIRGGHARAKVLTSERRSEIAKIAAQARWSRHQQEEEE